jgi:hypothetical protein
LRRFVCRITGWIVHRLARRVPSRRSRWIVQRIQGRLFRTI